jgi:hypothetical protein
LDARIDPQEIGAFAKANNMDASAAIQEFSSIDVNGDGLLDSAELLQVFGSGVEAPAVFPPPQAAAVVEAPASVLAPYTPVVEAPAPIVTPYAPVFEAPAPIVTRSLKSVEADGTAALTSIVYAQQPVEVVGRAALRSILHARDPIQATQAAGGTALTSMAEGPEQKVAIQDMAQRVADQLTLEETEEMEARNLDRQAAAMRANFTMLAKTTEEDALEAGVAAAEKKSIEMLDVLAKLQDQAERAEVKGAALREKSKMEYDEANELMSLANKAFLQQP